MIIFFLIIYFVTALVKSQSILFQSWKASDKTTPYIFVSGVVDASSFVNCGKETVMGGLRGTGRFGRWTYLYYRFVSIPPHSSIQISMKFVLLDDWKNNTIYFEADGLNVYRSPGFTNKLTNLSNICGDQSKNDQIVNLNFTFPHSGDMLLLKVQTDLSETEDLQGWALLSWDVYYQSCDPSCLLCSNFSSCSKCPNGAIIGASNKCECDKNFTQILASPLTCVGSSSCSAGTELKCCLNDNQNNILDGYLTLVYNSVSSSFVNNNYIPRISISFPTIPLILNNYLFYTVSTIDKQGTTINIDYNSSNLIKNELNFTNLSIDLSLDKLKKYNCYNNDNSSSSAILYNISYFCPINVTFSSSCRNTPLQQLSGNFEIKAASSVTSIANSTIKTSLINKQICSPPDCSVETSFNLDIMLCSDENCSSQASSIEFSLGSKIYFQALAKNFYSTALFDLSSAYYSLIDSNNNTLYTSDNIANTMDHKVFAGKSISSWVVTITTESIVNGKYLGNQNFIILNLSYKLRTLSSLRTLFSKRNLQIAAITISPYSKLRIQIKNWDSKDPFINGSSNNNTSSSNSCLVFNCSSSKWLVISSYIIYIIIILFIEN